MSILHDYDMGNYWQVFWLQQGMVMTCIFSLKQAKAIIEQVVREAPQIATGEVETEPEPHNMQCNLLEVMVGDVVSG